MSIAREQPRARRTPWIGVLIVALVVLGALAAWAWYHSQTRPVSAAATRRTIVANALLPGTVVAPPSERADLMAPFEAPVAKVYTTIGDRVERGEPLVEMSLPNAQALYEQARETVRAAETAYANARNEYSATVDAAKQQLEAARAAERAARQAPAVSVTPADPALAAPGAGTATGTAAPATGTTDPVQATADRAAAEAALQRAIADRETALMPYKRQLEDARAYFQQAQSGKKMAQIRAPISGTVIALNARPGVVLENDRKTPVVTIVDLDALQVHATATPEVATTIKPDMEAKITIAGLPDEPFEGEVESVTMATKKGLLGKQETYYVVIFSLENRKGQVKPGHQGEAALPLGEAKDVVAVPVDAVDRDGSGRPIVKVLRGGSWQPTIVEVGLSDGTYIEIKSGVKEGDTVQVTPSLKDRT